MIRKALVLCLSVMSVQFALAQNPARGSVQSTTVSYTPPESGFILSGVTFKYQFVNCYGEVQVMVDWEKNASFSGYKMDGRTYSQSEVGAENWPSDGRVKLGEATADLYMNSNRLGSVTLTYLVGNFAGCFGETFDVLRQVGLRNNDEQYKQNINSLYLRNIRITRADVKSYKVEEILRDRAKSEESARLTAQGDQFMARNQYDEALEAYQQAQRAKSSPETAQKISDAREAKIEARKAEQADDLIAEGDELMASGDHEGAARKYEAANRASPNSGAQEKSEAAKAEIERVREEEKAQKEEDKKKAEEEKGENEEEEGSSKTDEDEEDGDDSEESGESSDTTSSSSGGGGGYDEEYMRQQRMNEYYENRAEATAQNTAAAAELGASAMLIHYLIGQVIYRDMGIDKPQNLYKGPGFHFNAQVGYGFGSAPMFTNTTNEIYDGNNYYYTSETENYTTFMLELAAKMEVWPVFSREFGWGAFAGVFGGHGILFQQFSYGGEAGLKGHLGGKSMQLYGEYMIGYRSLYHTPWLDPGMSGNGVAEYGYQRLTAGPQITFDSGDPTDWKQIQLLGILERTSESYWYGNTPVVLNWSPGFKFVYNDKNNFSLFAEFVFQYTRIGEVEFGYSSDATYNGTLVRAGFHRRFDLHSNSALGLGSPALARHQIHNFNAWELTFMQPKLMWAQSNSGYHSNGFMMGMNPIGIHRTISYGPIGIRLGLEASYTALNIAFEDYEATTIHQAGFDAPIGLRIWIPSTLARYYVEYGRTFHYDLYTSSDSEFFEPESSYQAQHLSVGLVVPNSTVPTSVGIRWFRSSNEMIPETGIKPNGVVLTIGVEM